MHGKSGGAGALLIMIGVMLIAGAEAFGPQAQAQGRGKVARARNHNRGAAAQGDIKSGDVVSLTAVCNGKLDFRDSKAGSETRRYENVTIDLRGDSFTIDGADPLLARGKLSAITRSRNRRHLSLSVNLTASPIDTPVFTISLRGCYNRSDALCEDSARGQGAIDNKLRLNNVKGDLRLFSFESDSCTTEPQITR